MRITVRPDGVMERVGLLLNLVPTPIGEAMFAMPIARSLQVAQQTGLLGAIAKAPRTAEELAKELTLKVTGTRLVLDVITTLGHLTCDKSGRYAMTERARRWLDPASDKYLGDFLTDTAAYWAWWEHLDALVRDGTAIAIHDKPIDDPYWQTYIRGQYQLARLSSAEVASLVPLLPNATSLLDVAGAHGEFSMALCRRYEGLKATIVDLPPSVAVGRKIVAEAKMESRVTHVEGDMFEADFGGPHDGSLCFNIIHHLTPDAIRTLFAKVRKSLEVGAPLCVLELFNRPADQKPDSGAILGLFFHLTSGADTYRTEQVAQWLRESGFGESKVTTFRSLPNLAMLSAKAI